MFEQVYNPQGFYSRSVGKSKWTTPWKYRGKNISLRNVYCDTRRLYKEDSQVLGRLYVVVNNSKVFLEDLKESSLSKKKEAIQDYNWEPLVENLKKRNPNFTFIKYNVYTALKTLLNKEIKDITLEDLDLRIERLIDFHYNYSPYLSFKNGKLYNNSAIPSQSRRDADDDDDDDDDDDSENSRPYFFRIATVTETEGSTIWTPITPTVAEMALYLCLNLCGEWYTGIPCDKRRTGLAHFRADFEKGQDSAIAGFVTTNYKLIGISEILPDRYVKDNTLIVDGKGQGIYSSELFDWLFKGNYLETIKFPKKASFKYEKVAIVNYQIFINGESDWIDSLKGFSCVSQENIYFMLSEQIDFENNASQSEEFVYSIIENIQAEKLLGALKREEELLDSQIRKVFLAKKKIADLNNSLFNLRQDLADRAKQIKLNFEQHALVDRVELTYGNIIVHTKDIWLSIGRHETENSKLLGDRYIGKFLLNVDFKKCRVVGKNLNTVGDLFAPHGYASYLCLGAWREILNQTYSDKDYFGYVNAIIDCISTISLKDYAACKRILKFPRSNERKDLKENSRETTIHDWS